MRFETKIGIAVRGDLAVWQKLNVMAFLASGVATKDGVIGLPYEDADGNRYLPLFREPVLVYQADARTLTQVHQRAMSRALATAVYTEGMFKTGNDDDNRAVVRAVAAGQLDLVGLAVYGKRGDVDMALKGLSLHP